jgi:hypothetical protein
VNLRHWLALILFSLLLPSALSAEAKRVVVIKLDGVPHDLLERELEHINPSTGKSSLPWIDRVFVQQGTRLQNFYVRAISLSAPSWSLLDTGSTFRYVAMPSSTATLITYTITSISFRSI